MNQKPLDRLKQKAKQMEEDILIIKKAIEIMEREPDWAILLEAMNH